MIDDQATSAIKVSFDGKFFERAAALAPADSRRVFQAIDKFLGDPYHPSLNLEKLSAVQITNGGSVYSIRASERVRILLEKVNHTWVFCIRVPTTTSTVLRAGWWVETSRPGRWSFAIGGRTKPRALAAKLPSNPRGGRMPRHRIRRGWEGPPSPPVLPLDTSDRKDRSTSIIGAIESLSNSPISRTGK